MLGRRLVDEPTEQTCEKSQLAGPPLMISALIISIKSGKGHDGAASRAGIHSLYLSSIFHKRCPSLQQGTEGGHEDERLKNDDEEF